MIGQSAIAKPKRECMMRLKMETNMKRFLLPLAAIIAILVPAAALAFSMQSSQVVTLPKGQTKTGTYYAWGQVVTIDGNVNGDLICGGDSVTVNGAVHGDVLCAGQTITINGPVDGSVRLAGQSVDVNGSVGRNGTVAAQSFNLGSSAHITGDLGVLGQTATISGPVDQDIYGAMQLLSLQSASGGVNAFVKSLNVASNAVVHGDLRYTSTQTFDISKTQVTRSIIRTAPPSHQQSPSNAVLSSTLFLLYIMVAGAIVGLVLLWLAPVLVKSVVLTMLKRPGASIGWGAVVTFLGPILFFILFVTIIAIPLGLLASAIWGLLLITSGLFAGIATGSWILERTDWRKGSWIWATALGIPVLAILVSIPFLGALVALVATLWAVGGASLSAKGLRG
jgi:cytoskeletal protein CcmA (bactofilin family)